MLQCPPSSEFQEGAWLSVSACLFGGRGRGERGEYLTPTVGTVGLATFSMSLAHTAMRVYGGVPSEGNILRLPDHGGAGL